MFGRRTPSNVNAKPVQSNHWLRNISTTIPPSQTGRHRNVRRRGLQGIESLETRLVMATNLDADLNALRSPLEADRGVEILIAGDGARSLSIIEPNSSPSPSPSPSASADNSAVLAKVRTVISDLQIDSLEQL